MADVMYFKGEPVAPKIWYILTYLDPLYQERFGYELYATDGLRTMQDQWDAWNARQAYEQGRGPFAPVAAYPDKNAPHIDGFGVDLRDSAPQKTLTIIGSVWNEWLHQEAAKVGMWNEGRKFGEGWHFEVARGTQWTIPNLPAGSGSKPLPVPPAAVTPPKEEEEDDMSRNAMVFKFVDGGAGMHVMAFNTDTGWETIWATGIDATQGQYNNEIRKAFSAGETTAQVTDSHWDAIRKSNAELRSRIDFDQDDEPAVIDPKALSLQPTK